MITVAIDLRKMIIFKIVHTVNKHFFLVAMVDTIINLAVCVDIFIQNNEIKLIYNF